MPICSICEHECHCSNGGSCLGGICHCGDCQHKEEA
jgi:hypothetical protein